MQLLCVLCIHSHNVMHSSSNYTRKCTTLWGEPDRVHTQNMEQLHAFDCHQNVAEPQATENHKIYRRVHRNQSGLVIIYKHAAHRLVQHRLQVVEMAWTDDSTLAIFFTCATSSLHRAVVCSPVTNTGTVSQAANQDKPHFFIYFLKFFFL